MLPRPTRESPERLILGDEMRPCLTVLAFLFWFSPSAATAEQGLAKGSLLVANDQVVGDLFNKSVILLLHYDERGAMGIVVNRLTDVRPEDVFADSDVVADYRGTLFWGGPVQMNTVHVLVRSDSPPHGAETIVDRVHYVRSDAGLEDVPADAASLRFFLGYAGWAPGQLDAEMARGSWYVVPASDVNVFAEEPRRLWEKLIPPRNYRAAVQPFRH